jgi:membrane protein required for colicin V production
MTMLASLTAWDWFVVVVFCLSIVLGLLRGLVRTVFALGAWFVGLVGAALAGPQLLPYVGASIPGWVVYLAAFVVLFLAMRVLGTLVAKALRGLGLGGADRLLGGALGVARALLIVLLVAVGGHVAGLSREPAWQRATSRPLLDAMVRWVEPLLPERVSGVRRI